MDEGKIQLIVPAIKDKLSTVDKYFVRKDFLTQTDIDKMAEIVVDSIKEKLGDTLDTNEQKLEVILYILQPSQILSSLTILKQGGFSIEKSLENDPEGSIRLRWTEKRRKNKKEYEIIKHEDTITEQELDPFTQKIRAAVLDKVSSMLPPHIIAQIVKRYLSDKIMELTDDTYYKGENMRGTIDIIYMLENGNQIKALRYLHTLPQEQRSPFIYYGTKILDSKSGATINKPINLTTIEEALHNEEKPELSKILTYYIDIVAGHNFLLSNNLVLFDNKLDNLGIDKDRNRGILGDLEGLRRKNSRTLYIVPTEYKPPERKTDITSPATEANIVYELGISLEKIVIAYLDSVKKLKNKETIPDLKKLVKKMTKSNPGGRPTLEQVQEKLEEIWFTY